MLSGGLQKTPSSDNSHWDQGYGSWVFLSLSCVLFCSCVLFFRFGPLKAWVTSVAFLATCQWQLAFLGKLQKQGARLSSRDSHNYDDRARESLLLLAGDLHAGRRPVALAGVRRLRAFTWPGVGERAAFHSRPASRGRREQSRGRRDRSAAIEGHVSRVRNDDQRWRWRRRPLNIGVRWVNRTLFSVTEKKGPKPPGSIFVGKHQRQNGLGRVTGADVEFELLARSVDEDRE